MNRDTQYKELLGDLRALLEANARGTKRLVSLSPEVAEALERVESVSEAPPAASAGTPAVDAPPGNGMDHEAAQAVLADLAGQVAACTRCSLSETRTQTVFGTGNAKADLVFVGEAPGFHEDQQGQPFVGRAGELLTAIIEKGMKRRRDDVYICNVLKCRPPDNRDPNPQEVAACEPWLIAQLDVMRPKAIVALGRVAAQTLLKQNLPVGKLRNVWWEYHGIPLRVTYHPAYLLRNEAKKRECWQDVQEVMCLLDGAESP